MAEVKKKFFVWSSVIIGIVIGLIASMGIADALHATGSGYICTICHTMDPMNAAYHEDVHGGNNKPQPTHNRRRNQPRRDNNAPTTTAENQPRKRNERKLPVSAFFKRSGSSTPASQTATERSQQA